MAERDFGKLCDLIRTCPVLWRYNMDSHIDVESEYMICSEWYKKHKIDTMSVEILN